MFGWGSSDINDLITNTVGTCFGFLIYCFIAKIIPADLKKQLQSRRVNAAVEVASLVIIAFVIMVTVQPWVVHSLLKVP